MMTTKRVAINELEGPELQDAINQNLGKVGRQLMHQGDDEKRAALSFMLSSAYVEIRINEGLK